MTKSQEKSINYLKGLAENYLPNREIKEIETKEFDHFISLVITTGIPEDDGTYAVYIRDHCHFFIGRKGGITYPGKRFGHTKAKKFNGLYLTVVCEQNR